VWSRLGLKTFLIGFIELGTKLSMPLARAEAVRYAKKELPARNTAETNTSARTSPKRITVQRRWRIR